MIRIEHVSEYSPKVEIVERKGLGHPDTICDGVAESASVALSKYYLREFGAILHQNVDKGLLIGGEASPRFGGGGVISPIRLIVAGRAVKEFDGRKLPVDEIVRESALNYLDGFKGLDPEIHVNLEIDLKPGSASLSSLSRRGKVPLANDTSFGVGFWPLTDLERLVLSVEKELNSTGWNWLGEDIKIMGLRDVDSLVLTIAAAQISKQVHSPDEYERNKERIVDLVHQIAGKLGLSPEVHVNTADDSSTGSYYLTVTGLSAESGDDGQVGRGNRANGLITPFRPMSLEAVAGKNPVNHVGKIYNLLANEIAKQIVELGATNAEVYLLSQIGKPINEPLVVNAKVSGLDPSKNSQLEYLIQSNLSSIPDLVDLILNGKVGVY